jgi:hypothetical protein
MRMHFLALSLASTALMIGCTPTGVQMTDRDTSAEETLEQDELRSEPLKVTGHFWTTTDQTAWGEMETMENPVILYADKMFFPESITDSLPNGFATVMFDDTGAQLPREKSGFATLTLDPQRIAAYGDGGSQIIAALAGPVESLRINTSALEGNLEQMGYPLLQTGGAYEGFIVTVKSDTEIEFSRPMHISAPFIPMIHGGYSVELTKDQLALLPLPEGPHSMFGETTTFRIANTLSGLSYNPDPDIAERGTITATFDRFTVTLYGSAVYVSAEATDIERLDIENPLP